MTEFELKFQVAAEDAEALQAAMLRGKVERHKLRATYYDTPDAALAARRIVLRLRQEDGQWVQTAKAPGEGLLARLEHNAPLQTVPGERPVPRIERHRDTPLAALIQDALQQPTAEAADACLQPVYTTDVQRMARSMRTGNAQVELAFDRGTISALDRQRPVCELEIELKSGSQRALVELAQRWCFVIGSGSTASPSRRAACSCARPGACNSAQARPPELHRT